MTTALIMAGGRGERMRATGRSVPKPLISIRGVPLLERNLLMLLHSGFRDLVAAVPAHTPELARFVQARCQALCAAAGARLRLLEETTPLGNIGAAAEVEPRDADVLVVYADNLTSLDFVALVRHHSHSRAALTSAVHFEPFRIPYGEVQVEEGRIVAYLEKPERRVLVSSGIFVLGPKAIAGLQPGQRTEVSGLVNHLLAAGHRVSAFLHQAPWIDVNDSASVQRAERLLAEHSEAFECLRAPPERTVVSAFMQRSGSLLVERRPPGQGRYAASWDLPGVELGVDQNPRPVLERQLREVLHLEPTTWGSPVVFDDLDPASRQMYRHVVFPVQLDEWPLPADARRNLRAVAWPDLQAEGPVSPVVVRARAAVPDPSTPMAPA